MEEQNQNNSSGGQQAQQPKSDNQTLMGILAYIGILVIIPILTEKENKFVKFHVKQGLVLFALEVVVFIIASMFWMLAPFIIIVQLGAIAFSIIGIINVINVKEVELPIIGQFSKFFDGIIK